MKKKGIALIAMLAMSVAAFVAGCDGNSGDPNDPNNPNNPTGPKDDVYQDYDSNKQPGGDSFDYEGNYSAPELTIDGKGDEAQWQAITEPLLTYGRKVDDGNGGTVDAVTVKAYRGEKALFFLFDVKDTTLLTYGVTNDDAVTRGDSIEFYIDTKADGGRNPQSDDFQINLGIHGKTRIMQGSGSNWGSWNGLIDYEVSLNGTLNDGDAATDTGYSVEVMIQYKDIMIEKEDTIGLAFGQVDKVRSEDAPSGSETGPWNWYGWTYNGTLIDPQKPNMYVMYDKDGNLTSRDDLAMPPADMAGSVTDKSGNPVAGATATATIGGEERTATTDGQGYFVFEKVDSNAGDYVVSVTKENYTVAQETYTRAELREVNGKIVVKNFVIMSEAELSFTTLTGTVKNIVNGAVGGATLTLKGTPQSTTANADGTFSFENIPSNTGEITIVVSKNGYRDSETTIAQADLTENGETVLGDVNLSLPAAETGGFGMGDGLANNYGYFVRTLTGFEFFFQGENNFNGWIELFIDTKSTNQENKTNDVGAPANSRDASDVLYKLLAVGGIEAINEAGGTFGTHGMVWTVNPIEGAGYTAKLFIPYETLGVSALEPIGISLGQSNGQTRWDGWGRADMLGTNGIGFVAPEWPSDYIRLGATNNFYEATNNEASARVGGIVTAGDTPLAGVTVSVGGSTLVTGADGRWSIDLPADGTDYTVTYTLQGYTVKTSNISGDELGIRFSWSETAVLEEQKVSITGIVKDSATDQPIAGVTVSVGNNSVTTDADGRYTLANIGTFEGVTVTYTKDGYASGSAVFTAAELAVSNTHTVDKALISEVNIQYVTASGKIVGLDGPVAGATVTVVGNEELTATTDANGVFGIANFAGKDCTLKVEKEGYLAGTLTFSASALGENDETYAFDDLFLQRDYAEFGALEEKADPDKAAAFAGFTGYFTRSRTAIELKLVGTREWQSTANLEVYFNVTAGMAKEKAIILNNNTTSGDGWSVRIEGAETMAPVVYLTVPYAWLGIESTDIVGIAIGQWSTAVSDWDPLQGVNADVASEYLRLDVDNVVFRYATNNRPVTITGNAVVAGVTVTVGGVNATSEENGDWSLVVPSTKEALTITYSKTGYVTQTATIAAGELASTRSWSAENVTLQEQIVILSGTVVDQDGAPIEGAKVELVVNDATVKTAETDVTGRYTLTDVKTFTDVKLVFSAGDGYTTGETAFSRNDLSTAEGGSLTADKTLTEISQMKKITVTGKVVGIEGALQGATVKLGGETLGTTGADGTFTLTGFELKDCRITVSLGGHLDAEIPFGADDVGDATEFALRDIYLAKEYADMGGTISTWQNSVTRGENGFMFRFVNSEEFTGMLQVYVDTKASHGLIYRDENTKAEARNATDYEFRLKADNAIEIINYGGGSNTARPADMLYSITQENGKTVLSFVLPYTFLGVARDEIIGVSLGCDPGSGWIGWTHESLKGANGEAFVKPEMTADYLRIGKDNVLFENNVNCTLTELDLRNYNIAFGVADDMFFAKVERDETGVTFSFATLGDFNKNGSENEMILIYFDFVTQSPGAGGAWSCVDYLVKIASDGTVYGSNGEGKSNGAGWWSATPADATGWDSAVIVRKDGVTTISYHISIAKMKEIGLGSENEIFGVVMREASHNAVNHNLYGEWYDCNFEGKGRDANGVADYIRIAPDGKVYTASDNTPITE